MYLWHCKRVKAESGLTYGCHRLLSVYKGLIYLLTVNVEGPALFINISNPDKGLSDVWLVKLTQGGMDLLWNFLSRYED